MSSFKQQQSNSYLQGANATFIESFYEDFLRNPDSVDEHWRNYFRGLTDQPASNGGEGLDIAHGPIRQSFKELARRNGGGRASPKAKAAQGQEKQASVLRLINAHRTRGHEAADIDPLKLRARPPVPDLDPAFHGLSAGDMNQSFNTGSLMAPDEMKLGDIIDLVKEVYTGTVGAQYMHISDTSEKRWIQKRLEDSAVRDEFVSEDERLRGHKMLSAAEGLEKYLHTKYVGQKRFSLEGGESLIVSLDALIRRAMKGRLEEVIIGMAHRGRLNVLVNILGKAPGILFDEFEGNYEIDESKGSGDVKYHMGFSSDVEIEGKRLHLVLAFNPSHLEIVNPVVEGSTRSRQDRRGDDDGEKIMPVLIHGDSAISGQGIIQEVYQLSQTRGYKTGGTVHIVVNNQVGFTTSDPRDMRSTQYCTDVIKMLDAPIFHVNGDDPDAVVKVTQLAMDYRNEFHKDVLVDIVCYRRLGHNEADEPSATQPMMYKLIKGRPSTRTIYAQKLIDEGVITEQQDKDFVAEYRAGLNEGSNVVCKTLGMVGNEHTVDWSRFVKDGARWDDPCDTSIPLDKVKAFADKFTSVPDGHELHPRVSRIVEDRKKMAAGALPIDWGFAEHVAYAGLVTEGYGVRISGQDSGRGTFFHRHAVLHNQRDGENHIPLQHIADDQEEFEVIDSLLSEEAVLGFEYGYSTADPMRMVIWEAQFGDFANGAQVVIDQFITSGESKWGRLCGLAMFLPHGYEGQGPEHSSARLERYLQLCAEHNVGVCVPSTPAQMFHMIRRQMLRDYRKPLIVMTPKSLLRNRMSMSSLDSLSEGRFEPVIDEVDDLDKSKVKRVVLCSGKVYYDILSTRREGEQSDVALVRVEQLYPFPQEDLDAVLDGYPKATQLVWSQEEPYNQGAWLQIRHRLQSTLRGKQKLGYAGRKSSASPAAGSSKLHQIQQQRLIDEALNTKVLPEG